MLLNTIQKTLLTRSNNRLPQPDMSDHQKSLNHHPHYDTVFAYIKRKKHSKKTRSIQKMDAQNIKRKPSLTSSVYFECNNAIPSEELLTMLNKVIAIL
ncbi:MAG: hypothetical protein KAH08_02025 [Methylococcales bacterium]|nr:hypothetical protein [Methylococcales bacterium]